MAVSKLWPVTVRLATVLDYASNPEKTTKSKSKYSDADYQALRDVVAYAKDGEKTERELFCEGIHCNPQTAREQFITVKEQFDKPDGIQAYHGYLSFEETDITPELAQQVGMVFAERMWGDRFQVLVTTHLNTEHEKRAMIEVEDKYTFRQSTQISMQTGLIGHLRADMDTDGNGFFSSWFDFREELKTDEFKAEFDEVINSLREEGDILHNRRALAKYCYCTPQSRMQEEPGYYGVRVDTEKYAYLLRLNPDRGEYNLYCYCYRRDWLDQHLKDAEKGIRFIDSHYKELFRIPDGGKVKIHYSWNEDQIRTCRYIDDYHVEIGSNLYHICEFAERMEYGGHTCEPVRDNLPERCYSVLSGSDEIIIIKRGEKGYFKTDIPVTDKDEARSIANEYNAKLGVSKAQEEAMKAGSMFGFQVPAADPRNYDADGKPVMPKDRGDAR